MPLVSKPQFYSRTLRSLLAVQFSCAAAVPLALAGDALRVMSLDVSNAPAIQQPVVPSAGKPAWRTSFGSERESKPEPSGPVPGLDADVVLLQGVTGLKSLNKAFPGRTWRLIVSRQMVVTDDPVDPRSYEAVSNQPATAVAVRYQAGLRVAGQEHFLAPYRPQATEDATIEPPAIKDTNRLTAGTADLIAGTPHLIAGTPHLIAGTAVRLNIGGRFVWVTSVAFAEPCAEAAKPCPQRDNLETWRQTKIGAGEAVITGGLRQAPLSVSAGPLPACADQSIVVLAARKAATPQLERAREASGLGCTAVADAGGTP